ncbi:hypothetical protein [Balneatrix alpica]|uniref:VanZ-like domain-containing protein n=1 Tax=Balneatrix alpica TaxID=75684 RepID=A0ABV5ZDF2_9GAMM|nr:hypothetical protein [Balneatrix alpica]
MLSPLRWLLFIGCCALLAYGLFRPEAPPWLFRHSDKLFHLLALAGLAISGRLAMPRLPGWLFWGGLLLLAPGLEYLQHIIQPRRKFSEWDALANLAGVLLAWIPLVLLPALLKAWRQYRQTRRHRINL